MTDADDLDVLGPAAPAPESDAVRDRLAAALRESRPHRAEDAGPTPLESLATNERPKRGRRK